MSAADERLDERLLLLSPADNVGVLRCSLPAGTPLAVGGAAPALDLDAGAGHKVAVRAIAAGEPVLKYGAPIGYATRDIAPGAYVHIHNMRSGYIPTYTLGDAGAYLESAREPG